jgi:hypothetical protein
MANPVDTPVLATKTMTRAATAAVVPLFLLANFLT